MGDDMDSAVKEAEEAIKEHCKEVNTELELLQPLLNQNSTQPQPNITLVGLEFAPHHSNPPHRNSLSGIS